MTHASTRPGGPAARLLVVVSCVLGLLAGVPQAASAAPSPEADRIAGPTRIDTAVQLSRHQFPDGASDVYLARSDVFADAVAAGSLTDGPVLLVPACGTAPAAVEAEITRLGATRVTALGGPAAVCDAVLDDASGGRRTDRIAGPTRIDTAVQLSRHQFPDGASDVYLARSDVFADAVAAGSLTDGPVLLVPACGTAPAAVEAEITRLGATRVTALGGPAAVCTDVLLQSTGDLPIRCGTSFVRDVGPATSASPVVSGTLAGGHLFVATRGRRPPIVGGFDPASGEVTRIAELPRGHGAWASTATSDRDLYVGTYTPAHLYHVDTATMQVTLAAELPDATYVHGLTTAPDGTVFVGTLPDGKVYQYDPDLEVLRDRGVAVPGEYAVRSIAATDDVIYAGVGARAHLMAIDRSTDERHDILPPELADQSFVYSLQASAEWIVAGTEPGGRLAVISAANPDDYRILPALGERTIDAIALDGEDVYFTGRTTGTVYHYDIGSDVVEPLAVPIAQEETRSLVLDGRTLLGTGGSGAVWRYALDTGELEVTDLATAGLPAGPELIQSMVGFRGTAYVGGHWGVQVHPARGVEATRLRVPGEPKAMVDVDGVLYMALYPSGELWRYDPRDEVPEYEATIGSSQARPRDMRLDEQSGRLLISSQSDYGLLGGALTVYDTDTGGMSVHRDVVEDHSLFSIATDEGIAYLGTEVRGGGGATPVADTARLAAWDVQRGRKLWDIEPVPGAVAIVALVADHGLIHGLTLRGTLFTVNPRTQEVLDTVELGASARSLVLKNGALFATSTAGLHRIDIDTLDTTLIRRSSSYGYLTSGPHCSLYAARGMRLMHANLQP